MTVLFHVSGWEELKDKDVGDFFVLTPGTQNAEGKGVYFSEGVPRVSAAEGAQKGGVGAIVIIDVRSPQGWWRTKNAYVEKFNRPRTWHSDNKNVSCVVESIIIKNDIKNLICGWRFS